MCKIAIRSMFTPGLVTVSSNCAGLPKPAASTTFTVYPVSDPPFSTGTRLRPATPSTVSSFKTALVNGGLRYYISRPASVSLQIICANGKVVRAVPASRQTEGWHPVLLSASQGASGLPAGVYFVRFGIDGSYQTVKRVLVAR
jgi:hypothetical protein